MENNVRYEVYSEEIEYSLEYIYIEPTIPFRLTKYKNEKVVFEGYITLIELERGRTPLSVKEYTDIEDALYYYLEEHNDNLSDKDIDVRFEITDKDSRAAYQYKEYYKGRVVREGWGWAKDFENATEREKWDKAVIEFNKEKGIKMPTQKLRENIDEMKSAVLRLDSELEPINIPSIGDIADKVNIASVIQSKDDDPCQFIESLIHSAELTANSIDLKEITNYYKKELKNTAVTSKNATANQQTAIVTPLFAEMDDCFDYPDGYFEQLDAEREEYAKQHYSDMALFEVVEKQEPEYTQTVVQQNLNTTYVPIYGNQRQIHAQIGLPGKPSEAQANSMMTTIYVPSNIKAGRCEITVNRNLAEEIKKIFEEIRAVRIQTANGSVPFLVTHLNGFDYRCAKYPNNTCKPVLSEHAYGDAIDLNPTNNPYDGVPSRSNVPSQRKWNRRRGRWVNYDPRVCVWTADHPVAQIFRKYGWGWIGPTKGDWMHFSKTGH